jgi:hypothetical protein
MGIYDTVVVADWAIISMRNSRPATSCCMYNTSEHLPNTWDPMFASDPEQSINYVDAHDNDCLNDKVEAQPMPTTTGASTCRPGHGRSPWKNRTRPWPNGK